ncbi:metallopeptidase family protein [Candidatus Saccharibacteria bacterium]|nr:metallopeptidase family protein [Candidatus Saccharibacteria bacterium]
MFEVSDERFQELMNEALASLPDVQTENLKNVAFLLEQEPTEEQRQRNNLKPYQTLLGLYEGVPLVQRQGMQTTLPDRITLFKRPITEMVHSEAELKEQIRHTMWHEIAHYYGLDHPQIHSLE